MKRIFSIIVVLLFCVLVLMQCSSSTRPPRQGQAVRTVEDVDQDLQQFKKQIRARIDSRNDLITVAAVASVLLNLVLFGFVLYYKKQGTLLAKSAPAPKKVPAAKKKPEAPAAKKS